MENPVKTGAGDKDNTSQCFEGPETPGEKPCFVVGIGASAGGQGPLEHLFTAMPKDCNLTFVVIMHLPPEGPSFLADLIRRYTPMEVLTAEDGVALRPNTVHVIPPGAGLTVSGGKLRVERAPGMVTGVSHPIDRFFSSLAADFGDRAMAVVLSGFGTDGVQGVKRIREAGGIVLVQDPPTAIHPAMPENVLATGAVDLALSVEELPVKIADIARGICRLPRRACSPTTIDEDLGAIFAVVKSGTGHDFSSYKKNTIMRRIERRMTVNESGGLGKYLAFLEQNPEETQALAQEILIGVTRFFRDPEAFEVLRNEVIPRLFTDRNPEDPVRIWHACCATGEEVYSVAMLVREHLKKENLNNRVQVFATDIDEGAVAQARSGLYPDEIASDVGEDRLKTFFTRSADRLQVAKELREMVLFASHSLVKDPPFSRLDLLVCRNFLIYLNPDMQKRLMSLFHLVLKPGGFLFLGSSESTGPNSELFAPLDQKWKIFQRRECERSNEALFPFTSPVLKLVRGVSHRPSAETELPSPGALAEKLLVERYSPPCVVVNDKFEVLHVSSRTKRYLEVPVGRPTLDILKMAREELRPALRAAICKAFTETKQVVFRGVKLAGDEGAAAVNIMVEPLVASPSCGKLVLVILEPAAAPTVLQVPSNGDAFTEDDFSRENLIRQLEEQLRITHEQLQFTTEQLDASNEGFMATNEELMSINEEFQSANEELQSTNEELEASKEELQALNEELVTVNAELQGKVEELNQANSDMENLFASSAIATIFLDRNLIIKRFSPAMAVLLNLIPADIGRPFRHLGGAVDWSNLPGDAREVLEKQTPILREVSALENGRCYIMRVLPYRTTAGHIDGIVVTLMDISERKRGEEELRQAKEEWERTFDSVPDLIAILDDKHRIVRANRAMAERLGLAVEECVGRHCFSCVHPANKPPGNCPHAMTLADGLEHVAEVFEERLGGIFLVSTTPLMDGRGRMIGTVHVARDITERKKTEAEILRHVEELERFNRVSVGRELRMIELKKEVNNLCSRLGKLDPYPLEFGED